MKIYFDTEFLEDGKTIDLISIGMVREDGKQLHLINRDCDWRRVLADDWLRFNVVPRLGHPTEWIPKDVLATLVYNFCTRDRTTDLEFWAYYAAYDWVAFCQLWGKMINLPNGFPMYCNDFKQLIAGTNFQKDPDPTEEHNALVDACWLRDQHVRFRAEQGQALAIPEGGL